MMALHEKFPPLMVTNPSLAWALVALYLIAAGGVILWLSHRREVDAIMAAHSVPRWVAVILLVVR